LIYSHTIQFDTRGHTDMIDVTDRVARIVSQSGILNGFAVIFTPSATSALTTIEYESGALKDLQQLLDQLAPEDGDYHHNARWGDFNGHSHLRAALLGPSLAIPIHAGSLTLGTWQQILFIDFDNRPRQREIFVQIHGETA
jgi:secondary thiamine-phosphate synthase enzyme